MDAHRRFGTSDHPPVPDAFGAFGVAFEKGAMTGSRWVRPRAQRRLALVLLLALLPTLSYFGHWPEATFTLPGSSLVLGLPGSLAHTHGGETPTFGVPRSAEVGPLVAMALDLEVDTVVLTGPLDLTGLGEARLRRRLAGFGLEVTVVEAARTSAAPSQ